MFLDLHGSLSRTFVPARVLAFACLCAGIALAAGADLYAHHPGSSATARALPGGRAFRPVGQVGLVSEYRKGERGNRHSALVAGTAEVAIVPELLGLTFEVPYIYYRQKNRNDAARYGRARAGLRLNAPLEKLTPSFENLLLVFDADFGFPAGSNRDIYVDEPFADARAGLSMGYARRDWFAVVRGGGVFPASRLPYTAPGDFLVPPWEPEPELIRRETHRLKKVTEWQGRIGVRLEEGAFLYLGGLYRTPYRGIVHERAYPGEPALARIIAARLLEEELPDYTIEEMDVLWAARPPAIYREAEVGLILTPLENWTLVLGYRYPLYRLREISVIEKLAYLSNDRLPPSDKEFRLQDEIWELAVVRSF